MSCFDLGIESPQTERELMNIIQYPKINGHVTTPLFSLVLVCVALLAAPSSYAQNGIVFPDLLGNDLTDPEDDGLADATVTSGGTSPGGEGNTNAIDNSTASKWLAFEPNGTFYQIQLSSGPAPLLSYSITSANDAEDRDPYSWVVRGSNNGISFTDIETRTAVDFVSRFETQLFSIANPTTNFEYYRFEFLTELGAGGPNPGAPNSIQLAEIELFDVDRSPLLGDIDGDGDVDLDETFVAPGLTPATDGISDANILRDALGDEVLSGRDGDLDGDRFVTLLDFRILKDLLQAPPVSANQVPEPSGLLLGFVSLLTFGLFGKRRRAVCLVTAKVGTRLSVVVLLLISLGTVVHADDPIATIITTNETTPNFTPVLDFDINTDLNQPFNEGGLARSNTIFNSALKKNSNARLNEGRVMVHIEPEERGTDDSQGGAFLEQYTFAHWQYIDRFVDWGGTSEGNIKIPRSGWIDAAHRNGVKIYGNVFMAPTAFGGTVSQVQYLVQQDPNGAFPVADKLIEVAETQGFDGYFLNQEVSGVGVVTAELVGQFMEYVQANSDIEMFWYDAMTESGVVGWQDQLNSQNDRFFQNAGQVVSDAMFLDFGASVSRLNSSKTVANGLGRSEFDLYAGALLEANGIAAGANQLINSFNVAGLAHRSSLGLFRPDNAPWEAATAGGGFDLQAMIAEDTQIYVGATGDPTKTINPVPGTNWQGIANFVAAKSPLVNDTFMTNFNYGLGTRYAIEGEINTVGPWNNIGLQDVLPSWRWIVSTTDPTPLDAEFAFDDPYHGGSSVRFSGSLNDDTTVPLYLAEIPVHSDSKLSLTFKTGEVGASSAEVLVSFVGSENTDVSFPLGSTSSNGWNTSDIDLSGFAGQTIASIGVKFLDNDDPDYELNLGRLGVIRGVVDVPAPPTNASAQSVEITDSSVADVRLLWDHSTDYSRDASNGIYNYNVFRQDGSSREFLGGASTNAYFVNELERGPGELVTVLEVEAVGNEFGVSASEEYKVRWESTAVITVDRETGAVILANPLASTTPISEYTISAPGGVLNPTGWNSLTDQSTPGWSESSATTSSLSESEAGSSFQMLSDTDLSLGQAFNRTELAFGIDEENITFEYTSGGSPVVGNVVFVGESTNNLTLYVDPSSGNAVLQNTSTFDAIIDNYQILSDQGSLDPNAWQSLADQSVAGWEEANPSTTQLAELNFGGDLTIAPGETYDLGTLFTPGMAADLQFEFLLVGASSDPMQGRVLYQLAGDFNSDSVVNGLDFLQWQLGTPNEYELALWELNYGAPAGAALAAVASVPEPGSLAILLLGSTTLLSRRRK